MSSSPSNWPGCETSCAKSEWNANKRNHCTDNGRLWSNVRRRHHRQDAGRHHRDLEPRAELLFGYTNEEARGQSIDILLPPEQSQAMPEIMERIRHGEHVQHYETVRVRKDGTQVDVSLGISPIKDVTGTVVGIWTIARDITERKRTERLLNAQHATTKVLASSTTVEEAVPKLLKVACESFGWEVGLFWSVDRQARVLLLLCPRS